MRGPHRIIVRNERVRYDFTLQRTITVLSGDSATGRTTLIGMIAEYSRYGADSGIMLSCDKSCCVLDGRTWRGQLSEMHDCTPCCAFCSIRVRNPRMRFLANRRYWRAAPIAGVKVPHRRDFHTSIVFVDEGNAFITTDAFADAIRATDNYYVIATRQEIPSLPYRVGEVCGIRRSGTSRGAGPVDHEFYRIDPALHPQEAGQRSGHAGERFETTGR